MESFKSIGNKVMPVLAAMTMACSTELQSDEQMNAALATLQKETDDLAREFEIAASNAISTGESFKEFGSQSGEVIVVDGAETYGCQNSNIGEGVICEKSSFTALNTNPNQVYLNRGESTIVVAGENGVQVVRRYDKGKSQSASTMNLNGSACTIHDSKEIGSNSASSSSENIKQMCAALRDKLRARLEKVLQTTEGIK